MGQIVKLKFTNTYKNENKVYEEKLIRIRDEIEKYLYEKSIYEDDELGVALAAGRYGTMKLTQLTGEIDTKNFVNDCIQTTLHK